MARFIGSKSISFAGALILISAAAHADGGRLDQERAEWRTAATHQPLPAVNDGVYRKACGGCHLAYQPGLLPAASWEKLLGGLSSHFAEKVQIPSAELTAVRNYLLNNAAGRTPNRVSDELINSIGPNTPMRISETAYFTQKHKKVPAEAVSGDPAVRSFSNCAGCHTRANEAKYDKSTLIMPSSAPGKGD